MSLISQKSLNIFDWGHTMSYFCPVSFKKLKPNEIQPFLTAFKKEIINHLDEVAEEKYIYCSDFFHAFSEIDFSQREVREKMEAWTAKLFRYRFYFEMDGALLCIFGVPKCAEHLFDSTICFQNSTDQDYDFETWDGIREFKGVAEKWRLCSDEDVAKEMVKRDWNLDGVTDFDYYRKAFCYQSIFDGYVADYLYDDSIVLYLSLFGFYDTLTIHKFSLKCIEKLNAFHKTLKEDLR